MGRTIGIDLGTTNTVMAWVGSDKRPEVILTRDHDRGLPSVVTRYRNTFLVGQAARNVARGNPSNFVFSVKRLIGRRFSDPEVARVARKAAFRLGPGPSDPNSDDVTIMLGEHAFTPIDISAEILRRAKSDAELYFNEPVTHAVITVPAYFDDSQKAATREAGRRAGLKVRKILDEPSAAALAFGLSLDTEDERTIVVYDLGGGTFDISVISISDGISIVEAVKGDMWLGGNVFDEEIMEFVLQDAERQESGRRLELCQDPFFMGQLREQSEQAKKTLGNPNISAADIFIPGALNGAFDLETTLTRVDFEDLIRPYVAHSIALVDEALESAGMTPADITDVLLVGGSTAVPLVRAMLAEHFSDERIRANVNPMECVAIGAALQAQMIPFILCECGESNEDDALDCARCGRSLGTTMPTVACPECGAQNEIDAVICANVACSRALAMDAPVANPYGIGLDGDRYKIIIPVGTRYPMTEPIYEKFFTSQPNQSFLAIPVYQGEVLDRASRNAWQGQISLTIPEGRRGPAGMPLRLGMAIDRDGVLTVTVAGEGHLLGVDIAVQVDRSRKTSICSQCGHRNPQEALQCIACNADLENSSGTPRRTCLRCQHAFERSAPACPRCGFAAPPESEEARRSLNFQLVLARIGTSELDWILPDELCAGLKPLMAQAEELVRDGGSGPCELLTKRLLGLWEQTLFHDLAFCLLLSRSNAGSIQQRQDIAALFEALERSVRMGDDTRSRESVDRILAVARQVTAALDNITCQSCFQTTPRGVRCAHCGRSLRESGSITDEGAAGVSLGFPALSLL